MFAAQGARVVVNARNAEAVAETVDEIRAAGGEAIGIAGAVEAEGFAETLVGGCIEAFGGIDILVNNAAILPPGTLSPVLDCSFEAWKSTLAVNLDGPFRLCQAALPHMIAQRWGRIINASSKAGTGEIGGSAYGASKAAIAGLTRAMAADYGPYGITVNAYNPEALTSMGNASDRSAFRVMLTSLMNRGLRSAEGVEYSMTVGGPETIAPLLVYLCTEAAENLNGQIFAVESRRIAMLAAPEEMRTLVHDHAASGNWTVEEIERMAPLAFPVANAWPRRTGEALERWIDA